MFRKLIHKFNMWRNMRQLKKWKLTDNIVYPTFVMQGVAKHDQSSENAAEIRKRLSSFILQFGGWLGMDCMNLIIDMDGTYGYSTKFLKEVFGGLSKEFFCSSQELLAILIIKSDDEPSLVKEIQNLIVFG